MRGRIITLPDMQYSTRFDPQWMEQMFDHCHARRPDLVLSMGDMMEDPGFGQEARIAAQFARLTAAGVKALPMFGNHDYSDLPARVSPLNGLIPNPAWTTAFEGGSIGNVYCRVVLSGVEWLIFVIECFPREAVLEWVRSVLAANPGQPTLVATHVYLCWDGFLYTEGSPNAYLEPWYPRPPVGCHDGGGIRAGLVHPNSQIRLVLCGHNADMATCHRGAARVTRTREDGSLYHELLQDFQEHAALGGAWLTEYEFDEVNGRILVSTYSPAFRKYLYPTVSNPSEALAESLAIH
jgi:hypothetical protein